MSFLNEIGSSPVLAAEVVVIFLVFCLQVYFFLKTWKHCEGLKKIFSPKLFISSKGKTESEVYGNQGQSSAIVQLTSDNLNTVHKRIKRGINDYLVNNIGSAVSYSIIKDIIDREVDAKDHEISQLIPIPLYLGLAATIIGIIFGLFAMPSMEGATASLGGVDVLINGVKIAMFASLSGLFWTILLSSFIYNVASNKMLEEKNEQLTYLQETLLPVILKAEDVGVLGLKKSIDNFSNVASSIVNDIKQTTSETAQNLRIQQDTITKIEQINVTKISKTNLELFSRLEDNMESFRKFSEYIRSLEVISEKLYQFSLRTESIEKIASQIDENIKISNTLTQFLVSHIDEIKTMGENAQGAVDSAEMKMADALQNLTGTTEKNISRISEFSDTIESELASVISALNKNITEVTEHHIEELTKVYKDSLPAFEELGNLSSINTTLQNINQVNTGSSTVITQKLEALEEIQLSLNRIAKESEAISSNTTSNEKLNLLASLNGRLGEITQHTKRTSDNTTHINKLTVVSTNGKASMYERTKDWFSDKMPW